MCIRSQLCQIDGCRGNHHCLRTIPVWVKVKGKKIKVNAILDDASNESFLNEEVAGALKAVLPNSKSPCVKQLCGDLSSYAIVNGRLTKEIEMKTCPRSVTGSYQVENWRASKVRWPHLAQCDHLVQRRMDWWTC